MINIIHGYAFPKESIILKIDSDVFSLPKETLDYFYQRIKNASFFIAITDHGNHISAIKNINTIPLKMIIIAGALIHDSDSQEKYAKLVKSIIALAKQLNVSVLAEGVQNIKELEFLKAIDCQFVQGNLLNKIVSAGELSEVLKSK